VTLILTPVLATVQNIVTHSSALIWFIVIWRTLNLATVLATITILFDLQLTRSTVSRVTCVGTGVVATGQWFVTGVLTHHLHLALDSLDSGSAVT